MALGNAGTRAVLMPSEIRDETIVSDDGQRVVFSSGDTSGITTEHSG
jgi:hypothetical protein